MLAAFGVPFVPMWGILTFLLSFIPYLGGVVAAVAPLLVCLLEFSDQLWKVVVIAGLLIAIQQFLGNYVEPRMMGRRLGVSPLLIEPNAVNWELNFQNAPTPTISPEPRLNRNARL